MGKFSESIKNNLKMMKKVFKVDLDYVIKDFDDKPIKDFTRDNEGDLTMKSLLKQSFLLQQNEKVGEIEKRDCAKVAKKIHKSEDKMFAFTYREFETAKKLIEKFQSGLVVEQVMEYLDNVIHEDVAE